MYGGSYPFVQTGDIKAAGLRLFEYSQTYNNAGLAQSRLWEAGTLCITIAANICDTTILGVPACFPDSVVGFTANPDCSDTIYVKYALDHAKQRFTGISRGATQDNLSLEKMMSQLLPVPPLPVQRRIASILGAYDDLIEVNRRRIAVLEEMVRRLFDEWFVHFRFPGHDGSGRQPRNWRTVPLGSVADVNAASVRADAPLQQIGYIDISSVSVGTVDKVEWMDFAAAPGRARRRVRHGSVIWSTVRPNRRSYALLLDPHPDTIASTGLAVLDAKDIPFAYLYFWATTDKFVGYLTNNANGSAYPAVTSSTFERAEMMVPSPDLLSIFSKSAEPKLRLAANLREARGRLVASRDLLLPRLISGELSVAAAESELEDAA